MPEIFKNITTWLTTSGIKVLGILIALLILSQMSKWIVKRKNPGRVLSSNPYKSSDWSDLEIPNW